MAQPQLTRVPSGPASPSVKLHPSPSLPTEFPRQPLVNELQDTFSQLGSASATDVPQVALVGSQGSGKSSLLEALVGRDFLPRGPDLCTRRPLVLQLIQTVRRLDEWGEFLHIPGRRFIDFSAIRAEIQAETDPERGMNNGILEKPIWLKILSPNVLNMTFVDLPGITKVPVGGQPSNIEARVRTMILSYIKHEACIILAVSPGDSDLANSDALQMARIADPHASRTIGVITKLDIMTRDTDACNFLLGNIVPLQLGYNGVVNRSQQNIQDNKSIRDALAFEEYFFRSRPVYHSLLDRCGVPQLAKKLNSLLVRNIRATLPDFKAKIGTQIITLQKELAGYADLTDSKVNSKRQKADPSTNEGQSKVSEENIWSHFSPVMASTVSFTSLTIAAKIGSSTFHKVYGADDLEDLIDYVKDSQDDMLDLQFGGHQDARLDVETMAAAVSRELAQVDEAGCNHRDPLAEIPVGQETNHGIHKGYSYPQGQLVSTTSWEGGQKKQQLTTQDSQVCTPQIDKSPERKAGNFSLAQDLQDLTGEVIDSDSCPFVSPQDSELTVLPRGIPLAIQLQELVQQGKKVDRQWDTSGKRPASSSERRRSSIEDDIVETINSDDDQQKRNLEKGALEGPIMSTTLLWERFREALESAPVDIDPGSTTRHNSKQTLSSFSACLQNTLKKLKSQQMQFEKALTLGQSFHGLSECLVVLILRKKMEAQFTTCKCEVLQSPLEWKDCGTIAGVEDLHNPPTIEVIFSSKTSSELDLEIGGVVRVHPPWQEIQGGEFGKIILGTFFCEALQ